MEVQLETSHIAEALRPLATPIAQLKPDPKNARLHGDRNLAAIRESLRRFGQRKPVVARADGTIIAGNGTREAALLEGWETLAVVRVNDDDATAAAYGIADNRTAELAEWDDGQLAETLKWLAENPDIDIDVEDLGFTVEEFEALTVEGGGASTDLYTKKIIAPVYEPTGEKPSIEALADTVKTKTLTEEIIAAKIPEEVKQFLILAAGRHTVFNYQQIAEFYAHADKKVQALMEKSALVIIDFDKAIEQGLVVMSEEIAEVFKDDASNQAN